MNPREKQALAHLKKHDPVCYVAVHPYMTGIWPGAESVKSEEKLFAELVSSIISQQLSIRAADTIEARVRAVLGGTVSPERIAATHPDELRSAGLSRAKCKTLLALSGALMSGALSLASLSQMAPEEALAVLTRIWGIGPWTAEMFLIFSLREEDVFSAGDLILARSVMELYGLPEHTHRCLIEERARVWSPYRSLVSLCLWKRNDARKL